MLLCRSNDVVDGLFDSNVYDVVAVVGEDNGHEILADVVNVSPHGCQHHCPLTGLTGFLHVGFEESDSCFHDLCQLKDERKLHLAAGKTLPHHLHPGQQMVINDVERRGTLTSSLL